MVVVFSYIAALWLLFAAVTPYDDAQPRGEKLRNCLLWGPLFIFILVFSIALSPIFKILEWAFFRLRKCEI